MSIVINKVLSKIFKVFLKDYNKDQLDFNLFSGEATLNKIQLDEQVIHQLLNLPSTIEIKAIKCGLLKIKVPWRNLKHQPLVVHMDHIVIDIAETAVPLNLPPMSKLTKLLSTIASDTDESLKEDGINADNTLGTNGTDDGTSDKKKKEASKDSFIQKLMEEMTINLHDIIARITFLSSDRTSMGPEILMNLSSLCMHTTNDKWEVVDLAQARVIKKDIKSTFMYKEFFVGSLNLLIKAPSIGYQEILNSKPLIVKALLKRKFGTQMPYDINASIYNENIEITVNEKSLPQIVSSVNVILWCLNQSLIESTQKQQQQQQEEQQQQTEENMKNLLRTKNVFDEKKPKLPPKKPSVQSDKEKEDGDDNNVDGEKTKDKSSEEENKEGENKINIDEKESLLELEKEIAELTAESDLEMSSDLTYDDFPIVRATCNFSKISVKVENFFVLNIVKMCFGGTVEKVNFDDLLLDKPLSTGRNSTQRLSLTLPQEPQKSLLRSQVICEFSIEDITFTSLINNHSPQREFIRVEQKPFLSIGLKFRNLIRGRQYSDDLHNLELFGQINPVTLVVEPDFLEKMLDYVGMNFNLRHIIDLGTGFSEDTNNAVNSDAENDAKTKDSGAEDENEDGNGGGLTKLLNFLENPQISFVMKKLSFMLGKNMNLSKFLFVEVEDTLVSLSRYNHNSIASYTPITKEIIHRRQLEIDAQKSEEEEEVVDGDDYCESIEKCSSNLLDGSLIFSKISVGIIDEQNSDKDISYIIEPFDINLDFKVFRPVPLFGALLGSNSLLDLDYKILNKNQIPAISADLTITKIQVSIIQSKIYKIYDDFIFPFLDFVQKAIPVFVKSASQKREKAKMGELQLPVTNKSSSSQPGTAQEQTGPASEKLNSVKRKTAALKKLLEVRGEVAPFPFRVYLSGSLGEINVIIGCQDQLTKQIVDSVLKMSGGQEMDISAVLDLVYSMLALDAEHNDQEEMIHLAGVNFRSTLFSFSYVPSVPPSIKSLINLTKQQLKDNEAVDIEGRLNMKDFGIYFNPTKCIPVEVYLKPQDLALAYTELNNGTKSEITLKNNILVSYKYEMKKCVPKHNVDLVVSGVKIGMNSSLMSLFNNVQKLLVKESHEQASALNNNQDEEEIDEQKEQVNTDTDAEEQETKECEEENDTSKINEEKDSSVEMTSETKQLDLEEQKCEGSELGNGKEEEEEEEGIFTKGEETITEKTNEKNENETLNEKEKESDIVNEKLEEEEEEEGKENDKSEVDTVNNEESEITSETVKKIVNVGRGVTMNVEICDVEITCSEDSGKDGLGLKGSIKFTPYSNGKIEYIHNQYTQKQEELEAKHNADLEQLHKKIAEERKKFDNLENMLAEANVANASLRARIDEKNMEIRVLKREKAVQEKQLLQICEENIGLHKIIHGRVSSSGIHMQFQEIIKSMSTQSLEKEGEVVQLKQTIEDLQTQLSEVRTETEKFSIQWDKKFKDMEESYKNEIEDLRAKLAQKDAEITRLSAAKQENIAVSEKMNLLEKRIKELEEELLFSVRQNSAQRMEAISKEAKERSARTVPNMEPPSASERELMLVDARYKKKPLDLSTIHDLFTIDKAPHQPEKKHPSPILHRNSSSQTPPPSQPPPKPSRLSISHTGSSGHMSSEAKISQNQEQPPPIPQKPQDISKKLTMGFGKIKDKLNKSVDIIEQGGKKSLGLFKTPFGNEGSSDIISSGGSNGGARKRSDSGSNRKRSGSSSNKNTGIGGGNKDKGDKGFHI